MYKLDVKQLFQQFVIGGILAVTLIVKFQNVGTHSLWLDEAYTVWFTKISWAELWFWAPSFESHPPFYYSLMKLFANEADNDVGIRYRSVSIILSFGVVAVAYFIVRHITNTVNAFTTWTLVIVVTLVSLSPIMYLYSIEARPYMLLTFSYSLALYATVLIVSSQNMFSKVPWALFIIGTVITNWSHNLGAIYSLTLFLTLGSFMIFKQRTSVFFLYLFSSALIVILLCVPLLMMIFKQLTNWTNATWVPEPTISNFIQTNLYLFDISYNILPEKFGITNFPVLEKLIKIPMLLVQGMVVLCGMFFVRKNTNAFVVIALLSGIISIPLISFVISYYATNIFIPRTLIPVVIPYLILISFGLGDIIRRKRYIFGVALLIGIISIGFYDVIKNTTKTPWVKIVKEMQAELKTNDVILIFPNSIKLIVDYYDKEKVLANRMFALPAEYPALEYDFYPSGTPSVPGLTKRDEELILRLSENKSKIIVLTSRNSITDPDDVISKTLNSNFELIKAKNWGRVFLHIYESNSNQLRNEHE